MVLNGKSLHDLLMLVSEVAIPGFPFFRLYVKGISDYIFLIILLYVLMILLCTGNELRLLICGNSLSLLLSLNLAFK